MREYFNSLPGGFLGLTYNSDGLEWGYLIIKSLSGRFGSMTRISSMDATLQVMRFTDGTWGDWITK